MQVVTYRLAYVPDVVDLCDRHAECTPEWIGVLGAVQQGSHDGICDACSELGEAPESNETYAELRCEARRLARLEYRSRSAARHGDARPAADRAWAESCLATARAARRERARIERVLARLEAS